MADERSSDDEAPEAVSFSASRAKSVEEVKKRAKARASVLAKQKSDRRLKDELLAKRKVERTRLSAGKLLDPSVLAAAASEADLDLKGVKQPLVSPQAASRGRMHSTSSGSEDESEEEEEEAADDDGDEQREGQEKDDDGGSGSEDDEDASDDDEDDGELKADVLYLEDQKGKRMKPRSRGVVSDTAVTEPNNLQHAALAFRSKHLFGARVRRSRDDLARARKARRPATVFVGKRRTR